MIYSDSFVWLHVPKCAGTKIERLFAKYYSDKKGIYQDIVGGQMDPPVMWHDSIAVREARDPNFMLGNRTVICSFRRLPAWLMSRYSYEVQRSPDLPHRPERLLVGRFLTRQGRENHADTIIKNFLPKSILELGKLRFIRTEYFESDFKSVFGDYIDISIIPSWEYNVKENTSENFVPIEIKKKLYRNLQALYEECPYWKMVEDLAYVETL